MPVTLTRRRLLRALSAGGAVGIVSAPQILTAAEPLETTSVRLRNDRSICIAPMLVVEELLRAEGFSDIPYVDTGSATESANAIGAGQADLSFDFASAYIIGIDSGQSITVLAGGMAGCVELFA